MRFLGLMFVATFAFAQAPSACDVNQDGKTDAGDVDVVRSQVLQLSPCTRGDVDGDGRCTVLDLQTVINALQTGTCSVTTGSVQVNAVTATSTQAILAFTAPDNSPCDVKVAEDSAFASLVHDVDPVLFPGSNLDNRPGAISNGTSRVMVLGKRFVSRAADGNNYSLALQAFTTHYYKLTCGAQQTTGTFKTANIPMGMTYADALQPDASNPGQWALPTLLQDRNQKIVDPQTGALLRRVSLDIEKHGDQVGGVILSFGAFVRNCANQLQTAPDGTKGYLCTFFNNQAAGALYYIIPATGEVRSLGTIYSGYPFVNDAKTVYTHDDVGNTYRSTYVGDFQSIPNPLDAAAFSTPVLYNSTPVAQLMKKFDPTFDTSLFFCSAVGADAGKYSVTVCMRANQDSYGWVGVFSGGDGRPVDPNCGTAAGCPRIVAAMNVMQAPASKWCGLHNIQPVPGSPLVSINYSRLSDFSGATGTSAQVSNLVSAIGPGDTTIVLSGQPAPLNGDPYRQLLAVGDLLALGPDQRETMKIAGITTLANGQLSVQVTRDVANRGAQPADAGTAVWPLCSGWGAIGYWKYLNDPHGLDTTGANVVNDYYWGYGGHMDNGPLGRVAEWDAGWQSVYGTIPDHLNQPVSLFLDDSPFFAGVHGLGYGNTTSKHPSYQQDAAQTSAADQQWFLDMTPFDGGNIIADASQIKKISGQLYQYFQAPGYGAELARKQMATAASTGGNALIDVSGPNSRLSDQASDSYKYCVVDSTPGECRAGSKVGDIYINAPNVTQLTCTGGDGPNPANQDLCLGNFDPYYQGLEQLFLSQTGTADATAHSRVITRGLTGLKGGTYYSLAKSLPDASWALFNIGDPVTGNTNVWIAKLPPLRAVDTVDRSTFVPAPLVLTPPADSRIVSAVVDFGYAENGSPDQFRCTTRQEGCVANTATVNAGNPFQWASASYSGLPCKNGCTISLPLLPMHAAYYRARYLDAAGVTVATGQPGVVADGVRQ